MAPHTSQIEQLSCAKQLINGCLAAGPLMCNIKDPAQSRYWAEHNVLRNCLHSRLHDHLLVACIIQDAHSMSYTCPQSEALVVWKAAGPCLVTWLTQSMVTWQAQHDTTQHEV